MSDATCDKCGLELTTGAMAALCPQAMQCEFWPHSDGSTNQDGAELLIAKMWIDTACEQIGLQIDERNRLQRELADARAALAESRQLHSDICRECESQSALVFKQGQQLAERDAEIARLKAHADAMSNMIRGFIFKTVERETLADSAAAYRKWEEDYCHRHGRAAYPKEPE